MPYVLRAIDEGAGEALVQVGPQWHRIGVESDWRLIEIDALAATRSVLVASFESYEGSFDSIDALVQAIRTRWARAAPIPEVSIRDVLHLLPDPVQRAWHATQPALQRQPPTEPRLPQVSPSGLPGLWEVAIGFAITFFQERAWLRRFFAVEDLASEAVLRLLEAFTAQRIEELRQLSMSEFEDLVSRFVVRTGYHGLHVVRRFPFPHSLWWPAEPPYPFLRSGPPWSRLRSLERGSIPEEDLIDSATQYPDDAVGEIERRDLVEWAIEQLSDEDAALIRMHFYSTEKSFATRASELPVSAGLVEKRMKHILGHLRKLLESRGISGLE